MKLVNDILSLNKELNNLSKDEIFDLKSVDIALQGGIWLDGIIEVALPFEAFFKEDICKYDDSIYLKIKSYGLNRSEYGSYHESLWFYKVQVSRMGIDDSYFKRLYCRYGKRIESI